MKGLHTIINEVEAAKCNEIKNNACIKLIKAIGDENVEKLSSDNEGELWKIQLKGIKSIDLVALASAIQDILNDPKTTCIKSILFNQDTKTIVI